MNIGELKLCLLAEVVGNTNKSFSWGRVFRHAWKKPKCRFLFWWRIASFFYVSRSTILKKISRIINRKLFFKYGTEIELGSEIGPGFYIGHHSGIVISRRSKIGKNCTIRQNTTIGLKADNSNTVTIGDNVNIGAHTCIISENLVIGDNVTIGAGAFVNTDIPSNTTYYTVKQHEIRQKVIV